MFLLRPDTTLQRLEKGPPIDKATLARVRKFVELLGRWRKITNLISDADFSRIWDRHVLDAIYLQQQRPTATRWLDFGSGAGFPSAIIASVLADCTCAKVNCVEIDRRKCAFLREVASKIGLPLKVHNVLAEDVSSKLGASVDVVTARAFASLDKILKLAEPQMKRGAVALLPRGRSAHDEVASLDPALYSWKMSANPLPGDGVFLQIELRESHAL